jgi:hypothetical protein
MKIRCGDKDISKALGCQFYRAATRLGECAFLHGLVQHLASWRISGERG